MNELALFAGAGGGILGTKLLGWRTVCAVEIEPYCREILLRRQEDGILEPFPIWDDVRTFNGAAWRGKVDIISAGFPCQPFSVAGKRLGIDDARNLWPETIRIIRETRPAWCLLENVPGLVSNGYIFDVIEGLNEAGYEIAPILKLGADDVGTRHRRKRIWIIANAKRSESSGTIETRDITGKQFATIRKNKVREICETDLCGNRNGVGFRLDRLRAIGNGQVPTMVQAAWMLMTQEL